MAAGGTAKVRVKGFMARKAPDEWIPQRVGIKTGTKETIRALNATTHAVDTSQHTTPLLSHIHQYLFDTLITALLSEISERRKFDHANSDSVEASGRFLLSLSAILRDHSQGVHFGEAVGGSTTHATRVRIDTHHCMVAELVGSVTRQQQHTATSDAIKNVLRATTHEPITRDHCCLRG